MSFPETVVLNYREVKNISATKTAPLGTRGVLPDGRVFRYAKASAAITAHKLCTSIVPAGNYYSTSGGVWPSATTVSTTWAYMEIRTSHECDTTAEAANKFAEGYMVNPANGDLVRIKSHTGRTASSTEGGIFYFEDGDHLATAITQTDQCFVIFRNPYDGVINAGAVAGAGAVALGYPLVAVTTAKPYFWLQTWGAASVYVFGTHVAGKSLVHSSETAATAAVRGLATDWMMGADLGICMSVSATVTYGLAFIQLSP